LPEGFPPESNLGSLKGLAGSFGICFAPHRGTAAPAGVSSLVVRETCVFTYREVEASGGRKMFNLSNLSVKAKLGVLCLTFISGMVFYAAVSYTTIQSLRIGGARYDALVELMDLDADVTMPRVTSFPSSIWMFRMLLAQNVEEVQKDVQHFHETEKTFEEQRRSWMNRLKDGPIKTEFAQSCDLVEQYLRIIETQVIPRSQEIWRKPGACVMRRPCP
jgi:hypothetical protein